MNVLVAGLVGIAGIIGTAWGSWFQAATTRRAREYEYRRDLYAQVNEAISQVLTLEHRLRWARQDGQPDVMDEPRFLVAVREAGDPLFRLLLLGKRDMHHLALEMSDRMREIGNEATNPDSTKESMAAAKKQYTQTSKALRTEMLRDIRRYR